MAYRLFALLPLVLAGVSADNMESMHEVASVASVAEPMAPIPAQQPQQAPAAAAVAATITHEQADSIIKAAVAKALEIKMPSNIAIADPSGHLVSFLRMDGALLVSIEVAQKKAKTVSMFGGKYRTGDLYNATSPGGALYGIQTTNSGLLFFGGGVPLKVGGNFVGSLGVSGGTVDQDQTIANAAAQTLNVPKPAPASKPAVAAVPLAPTPAAKAPALEKNEDEEEDALRRIKSAVSS